MMCALVAMVCQGMECHGVMQLAQTNGAETEGDRDLGVVAAASAKKTVGCCCPCGKHQRKFVGLEIGMHLAHDSDAVLGIEKNSLPRYRRSVDRKPRHGLVDALGRQKWGARPWYRTSFALRYSSRKTIAVD